MSYPTTTRAIVLQKYVEFEADLSSSLAESLLLEEQLLPNPLPEDSLLVKTLYLSNDPAQRLWIQNPGGEHSEGRPDMVSAPLGKPFHSFSLSRVIQVGGGSGPVKVGDIVEGRTAWADYCVVKKDKVQVRREIPGISLSAYLGPLGLSGATAYFALVDLLKPEETDTLVVSGAAGAVGNVAVQYAKKVLGVKRVVAIAGSDEKCTWLKKLGADEAVNYKSPTFAQDLAKATPDKVDKFFDNVGGSVLDEVMALMNPHGKIAIVGAISLYNKLDQPATVKHYLKLILDSLSLVGFTVMDYTDRFGEAEEALATAAVSGKLILEGAETVIDVHGELEEIPRVWAGLFTGSNTGKLITKVAN